MTRKENELHEINFFKLLIHLFLVFFIFYFKIYYDDTAAQPCHVHFKVQKLTFYLNVFTKSKEKVRKDHKCTLEYFSLAFRKQDNYLGTSESYFKSQ